ncbi:MAG TPA: hypothetical protein ENJ90_03565, partial [Devosia sp.]|nr:hypothetical protein [Devosia sp.]
METSSGHVIARFAALKGGMLTGRCALFQNFAGNSMSFKKILLAGVAAMGLLAPASLVLAQETAADHPADQPHPEDSTTAPPADPAAAQNWLKVCEPLESGEKACIMRQVVVRNNQFLGSFLLRDDPGQESRLLAVAAVPLGVLLPFGLTWQIDGAQPVRVPFMLCDPQSCSTQLVVNEAYVNSLKRGGTLKLTAKNRQNQDLVIEINLAGFTAVYDSETSLTFE